MKNFTSILKEHKLKATPQRLAILESIFNHGHITIDNLYNDIKSKFSSISQATIYKNISDMTKMMLLLEVKLPNAKSVYEIVKENHSHVLCNTCKEITDIEINTSTITNNISKKYSFSIDQSNLIFSGTCQKCKDSGIL